MFRQAGRAIFRFFFEIPQVCYAVAILSGLPAMIGGGCMIYASDFHESMSRGVFWVGVALVAVFAPIHVSYLTWWFKNAAWPKTRAEWVAHWMGALAYGATVALISYLRFNRGH